MTLLVLEEIREMVPELELGPAAPAVHQAGVAVGMALLQIYGAALLTQAVDAWETTSGGAQSQQPMLAEHTTPAEPRDRDRQLLEVEVFAVAVSMPGERRVEVHVGDPEVADELIDGRPPQDTLVGQAEAREIRGRVQGSGLELLSVVDDGFAGCAVAAQEFVEGAGANRVVRGEMKGGTGLDHLRNVYPESAQTQARARRAARGAARGGELSDLEPPDGGADTPIEGELPPVQRRRRLGARVHGNCEDRRKNHQERPHVRHAGLLDMGETRRAARTGTDARPDAGPSGEDQPSVRGRQGERGGGWYSE